MLASLYCVAVVVVVRKHNNQELQQSPALREPVFLDESTPLPPKKGTLSFSLFLVSRLQCHRPEQGSQGVDDGSDQRAQGHHKASVV